MLSGVLLCTPLWEDISPGTMFQEILSLRGCAVVQYRECSSDALVDAVTTYSPY